MITPGNSKTAFLVRLELSLLEIIFTFLKSLIHRLKD